MKTNNNNKTYPKVHSFPSVSVENKGKGSILSNSSTNGNFIKS